MARESVTSRSGAGVHEATTVRLAPTASPVPAETLVLGRYRIGEVLGRGGMATVYHGEDTRTGREVAIKVLAPHLSADPAFRGRMLAEARAVARLPHPHIVQVYDAGQASPDEAVALIMELVPGEALDRRIVRGPLPLATAVDVATQVADALAFAHARGVVHRDVKPHNILLTDPPEGAAGGHPHGHTGGAAGGHPLERPDASHGAAEQTGVWAKLADFGIARSLDATTSYTATGLLMGSAPYIAPEVLQGAAGDERADVYSLGVTLFEALAGRLPFVGKTAAQALAQRLTQSAPRVGTFRPDVPRWLEDLVGQCLEREPERRIGSAAALAQALRQAGVATETLTSRHATPQRDTALTEVLATRLSADMATTQRIGVAGDRGDERPHRRGALRSSVALLWLLAALSLIALPVAYLGVTGAWEPVRSTLEALAPSNVTPPAPTHVPPPAPTGAPAVPVLWTSPTPAKATATSVPRATITPSPVPTRSPPTATARPAATEPPSVRVTLPLPASAAETKDGERSAAEARERAAALREQLRVRQQALRENARASVRQSKPSKGDDEDDD